MACIHPFRAWRYSSSAGDPANLLTQPYDKISPEMQERYYAASPHNLVRAILGKSNPSDTPSDNVYTRARGHLESWISSGVLVQDPEPALYAYFQRYEAPSEPGRSYLRKGLIALGAVEEYSLGTVHRHELTHSGPKQDRLELLRHTRAHCGQIFMLYEDPQLAVEACLDHAAQAPPLTRLVDDYGAEHSLWRIGAPDEINRIQRLMAPARLLIADGHHRYETALAFRIENPKLAGAGKVMMTFVNLCSSGLVILPTHRVVSRMTGFDPARLIEQAAGLFQIRELPSSEALGAELARARPGQAVLGAQLQGDSRFFALETEARGRPDAVVLHELILGQLLGLTEEAVRDLRHIRYVRGFEAASAQLADPEVQAVFFLNPAPVRQVAEVAFAGGVMPQKSTDFYPKMLSGMAIYRMEAS